MASNGLVANASKTALLFLNLNSNTKGPITIKVGTSNVTQETNAKLLGINIDENLDWKTQISGQVEWSQHSTQGFSSSKG